MLGEKFISDETPTSEISTTFLNEHKSDGIARIIQKIILRMQTSAKFLLLKIMMI